MTKKEVVDTALRGIGKTRVQGNTTEPIMPYLLADIMYQLFDKNISPLSLKHELKQMKKMWMQKYKHFNKPVFSAFKESEFTELTDLMDDVYDYLSNEIVMLRSKTMLVIEGIESFETKQAVSNLIMCHIFAEYADCCYQRVYYKIKKESFGIIEEPISNPDLCYLRDLSYRMAMQIIKETPGGKFEFRDVDMKSMFSLIAKKIYQWLKEN